MSRYTKHLSQVIVQEISTCSIQGFMVLSNENEDRWQKVSYFHVADPLFNYPRSKHSSKRFATAKVTSLSE